MLSDLYRESSIIRSIFFASFSYESMGERYSLVRISSGQVGQSVESMGNPQRRATSMRTIGNPSKRLESTKQSEFTKNGYIFS